tara:strand:+ start:30 stop:878 length:849 start_codon:yes stop_codon:yes gene_type:complete
MAKNKLAMISKKKSKKPKKTIKKKQKSQNKYKGNVVDVPFSDNVSLGSKASLGNINYHYQKYYNTFAFLKEIIKRNTKLQNLVCIPNVGSDWMQSFMKVHFFKNIGSLKPHLESVKPVDSFVSKEQFMSEIKKCMDHRLIPISLEIIVPQVGTHANIVLIDTKKKTVELFEPHGARDNQSELESISRAYFKISKNVHKFVRINFPEYKFIPPSRYEPEEGLQARLDAFSGLCVTWSLLYLHYRVLNPDVPPKKLIQYLEKKIKRKELLRYTRYVEDVLKGKV